MPQEDFEKLIEAAYERLPQWVRDKVKNVAILSEDAVSDELVESMNLRDNMDLLGLYQGHPLTDRDYGAGIAFPDTITLYKLPIEEEAVESGKPVSEVVFETLWHEIAHHFGLDEDAVMKREEEEGFGRASA